MFMKTFEEKFTAWVDGELKGEDLAEFEAELARVPDARLDKLAAHQLGDLFREHCHAPELKNEDFFNHQIMQQVEAGIPKPEAKPARRKFAWSLPRMAMAGAFSLVVAFGLFHAMIPAGTPLVAPETPGTVEIINANGGDPSISVSTFQSQENDVVIWVEGSKYVPDKRAQPEQHKEK
jgi:anti-sigma factor RsiW